ncbi:unnamed protein product [Rhodiola kirilowii]
MADHHHDAERGGGGFEIEKADHDADTNSIEKLFERSNKQVPPWEQQLTIRAFVVSFVLSVMFSTIVMKLNLTTGIIPSLNVSAGLLAFFFVKTWTKIVGNFCGLSRPFTRQENTVIQTCVVASAGIAFSGGFGSYLFAMSDVMARVSEEPAGKYDTKNPALGWMIGFLFVVSFLGLFSVVPLRKIMIVDFKLTYPSGTATAYLINSFHTPKGAMLAAKQIKALGKFFSFSFLWGFFQWFFTSGDGCGFVNFPTFGLRAYHQKFYFDFSATYVGVGMICPYMVNISLLLGGILSWGLAWPLIETKKGDWYISDQSTDMHGLQGYKIFMGIALILGDGLYNFFKAVLSTLKRFLDQLRNTSMSDTLPSDNSFPVSPSHSYDEQRRTEFFLKDRIPVWFAVSGYISIAVISTVALPYIFPQLEWYHVIVIYIFAPTLAFCNAYGCGLTDWSLASTYGKIAIFVIGAWVGVPHGIIAGLASCGVMMNIVSTASDLMQDFKTGYLTLTSPRSMFVSQVIGTAMGCIISPCVFFLFYTAFSDMGKPGSKYQAPFALIYRNMARIGIEGFDTLPRNCLTLAVALFAAAILINFIKDTVGKRWAKYIPLPMAMAIPFYIGPFFAIDMCLGSLILFIWEKTNKAKAEAFGPAVASGLICGDGIWILPSSILALAGVSPPICMRFLSSAANKKFEASH